MKNVLRDLRFGVRLLLKKPGFTFTVLLALSIGIGANTAIYSIFYATIVAEKGLMLSVSSLQGKGLWGGVHALLGRYDVARRVLEELEAACGPTSFLRGIFMCSNSRDSG